MLDKKQIQAIFLFEFKMGCKAVETTHNINNTFGPGTAKEHGGSSGGSRSFTKETRDLKTRSLVASHWKLTTTNWGPQRSWSSYRQWEVSQNSTPTIPQSFGVWRKLERWKSLVSGYLLTANQKTSSWSVIFSHSTQQQQTVYQSDCGMQQKVDCIWQLAMTSSVTGPRRSTRVLPKAKLAPEKVLITVGWSATGLIHYSSLNHGKNNVSEKYLQQVNEIHWKLVWMWLVTEARPDAVKSNIA